MKKFKLLLLVFSTFILFSCDTVKPTIAGVKDLEYVIGEELPDFLEGVSATDDIDLEVEVTYDLSEVVLSKPGVYKVIYKASDTAGNQAIEFADLTVVQGEYQNEDLTKPVISGVKRINFIIGHDSEVDYTSNVTASDDSGDLTDSIVVDSSQVDLTKEGTYKVIYSVSDDAGNETKIVGEVVVFQLANDIPSLLYLGDDLLTWTNKEDNEELLSSIKDNMLAVDSDGETDLSDNVIVDTLSVDLSTPGVYKVLVSVTDLEGNNYTSLEIDFVVREEDSTNPEFVSVPKFVYVIGSDDMPDPESYDYEVSDGNLTDEVEVTVEVPELEVDEEGNYVEKTYNVKIVASDLYGNQTEETTTLVVTKPTPVLESVLFDDGTVQWYSDSLCAVFKNSGIVDVGVNFYGYIKYMTVPYYFNEGSNNSGYFLYSDYSKEEFSINDNNQLELSSEGEVFDVMEKGLNMALQALNALSFEVEDGYLNAVFGSGFYSYEYTIEEVSYADESGENNTLIDLDTFAVVIPDTLTPGIYTVSLNVVLSDYYMETIASKVIDFTIVYAYDSIVVFSGNSNTGYSVIDNSNHTEFVQEGNVITVTGSLYYIDPSLEDGMGLGFTYEDGQYYLPFNISLPEGVSLDDLNPEFTFEGVKQGSKTSRTFTSDEVKSEFAVNDNNYFNMIFAIEEDETQIIVTIDLDGAEKTDYLPTTYVIDLSNVELRPQYTPSK